MFSKLRMNFENESHDNVFRATVLLTYIGFDTKLSFYWRRVNWVYLTFGLLGTSWLGFTSEDTKALNGGSSCVRDGEWERWNDPTDDDIGDLLAWASCDTGEVFSCFLRRWLWLSMDVEVGAFLDTAE